MNLRRWLCLVGLAVLAPGLQAGAQVLMDPADPRFPMAVALRRVALQEAERNALASRLVALAEEFLALPASPTNARLPLLVRAVAIADSLHLIESEVAQGRSEVAEARTRALAGGVSEAQITDLEGAGGALPGEDPVREAGGVLAGFARVVEAERAREAGVRERQEELDRFLGALRLFDETGMPPSARAQSGGDAAPGCPVSSCPTDLVLLPADAPWEHVRPEAAGVGSGGHRVPLEALDRLAGWLSEYVGEETVGAARASGGERPAAGPELTVGLGAMGFHRQGASRSGGGARVSAGWPMVYVGARGRSLTVEPMAGVRSLSVAHGSAVEVAGEVRETFSAPVGTGGVAWQVAAWQKGRYLSRELPLPVYLEPGRLEGGVTARIARDLHPSWRLEGSGGGDAVRYAADAWKAVDRQGWNAALALQHEGASRASRISATASQHAFPRDDGGGRTDTRIGAGVDLSLRGRAVMSFSSGVAWSASTRAGFAYRSARGAVVASVPWAGNSVQVYGAFAYVAYRDARSESTTAAPSDEDAGSLAALQFSRLLSPGRSLAVRLQWARSRTGFGTELVQRLGASVQMAFREWGGA